MKPTQYEKGLIEGYALGLWHLARYLEIYDGHCKSYDPAELDNQFIHSYIFDLKDGGRHHPLKDYSSANEVCDLMYRQIINRIKNDSDDDMTIDDAINMVYKYNNKMQESRH